MPRSINLRQIEAFKAVVENSTVSRAASILNISQPAVSKLIAHLEDDTGLKLFDRLKGRLAPTKMAMRLYEEVDRIFSGIRQVESAVEAIRREEQGQLNIGVMPALSGAFIQEVTSAFLRVHPSVYCSIHVRSSEWIADWLVTRKLDVGLLSARMENPYFITEPLVEHPLVAIMPLDHRLTQETVIGPHHLDNEPFISFSPESYTAQSLGVMFHAHKIRANTVLVASISPTLCEFVAAGLGISLVHPLHISGMQGRLAVRRFEPSVPLAFHLCRVRESRNSRLVEAFVEETREIAGRISGELFNGA
jgi:DNA-binding transcriptional LysR family regulator